MMGLYHIPNISGILIDRPERERVDFLGLLMAAACNVVDQRISYTPWDLQLRDYLHASLHSFIVQMTAALKLPSKTCTVFERIADLRPKIPVVDKPVGTFYQHTAHLSKDEIINHKYMFKTKKNSDDKITQDALQARINEPDFEEENSCLDHSDSSTRPLLQSESVDQSHNKVQKNINIREKSDFSLNPSKNVSYNLASVPQLLTFIDGEEEADDDDIDSSANCYPPKENVQYYQENDEFPAGYHTHYPTGIHAMAFISLPESVSPSHAWNNVDQAVPIDVEIFLDATVNKLLKEGIDTVALSIYNNVASSLEDCMKNPNGKVAKQLQNPSSIGLRSFENLISLYSLHQHDITTRIRNSLAPPPGGVPVLLRALLTESLKYGHLESTPRAAIMRTCQMLGYSPTLLLYLESDFGANVEEALKAKEAQEAAESKRSKLKRGFAIAAAALGGGALIAVTGGLAIPAIASAVSVGLGVVGVSSGVTAAAFLSTTGGFILVSSLFGAGGAGLVGYKLNRRLSGLDEFEFCKVGACVNGGKSLSVTVAAGGWLDSEDAFSYPWDVAFHDSLGETLAIKWETKNLLELGKFVSSMVSEEAATQAAKLWLSAAVGASAAAIGWPVALIRYAASLDNTWTLVRNKADLAGKTLAEAIMDRRRSGARPVTLIGFSMGARVIFECLLELENRGMYDCVSDAVLMGAPLGTGLEKWSRARSAVCGRLVNVYSRADWILAFLYRYMEWGVRVSGVQPVTKVRGVENFDVSGLVTGHAKYATCVPVILTLVGVMT